MDSSGSIGQCHYDLMINFIVDVCNSFNISKDGVRVGLVTFSDDSEIEFTLEKYNSAEDVTKAIRNAKYQEGMTNTYQALQDLKKIMKTEGRPMKSGVPRIAIVLTDGQLV